MPIPLETRERIDEDPYYKRCARENTDCSGRITVEHSWYFAGKRINDYWALIPLCVYHHLGKGLDKRINQAIAVARTTPEDRAKYPKIEWERVQAYLKLFAPPL